MQKDTRTRSEVRVDRQLCRCLLLRQQYSEDEQFMGACTAHSIYIRRLLQELACSSSRPCASLQQQVGRVLCSSFVFCAHKERRICCNRIARKWCSRLPWHRREPKDTTHGYRYSTGTQATFQSRSSGAVSMACTLGARDQILACLLVLGLLKQSKPNTCEKQNCIL